MHAEGESLDELVAVGRVNGVFGTRGWIKCLSYTRPRENLLTYKPWYVLRDGAWLRCDVVAGRVHHGSLIAQLAGCDDRDTATTFVRCEIGLTRQQFAAPAAGEYYWADLIGMQVRNLAGIALGEVVGLHETGAHDVLRVLGARERLVPFVREVYIKSVDLNRRTILVDWHEED
jgi:16S rRNA processing protein RimM